MLPRRYFKLRNSFVKRLKISDQAFDLPAPLWPLTATVAIAKNHWQ